MTGKYRDKKLSEVASRDEQANLHCPTCGATQFEAMRSTGRKLMFGVASLLAPANQVRCIICGEVFKR